MKNRLILASTCIASIILAGWLVQRQGGGQQDNAKNSLPNPAQKKNPIFTAPINGPDNTSALADTVPSQALTVPSTQVDASAKPMQIWQNLATRLAHADFQQIPIISADLAEVLRKYPDARVYDGITGLILQPGLSAEKKAVLLDLLAEIATPESLGQLLTLAKQDLNSPLYVLAIQAISRIGDNRWDGRFHEELSPVLETAWSNTDVKDPVYFKAVGKAIAEVGAPTGISQLLLTVSGANKDEEPEDINRIKQEVAFTVTADVSNPNAISTLSSWLQQGALGNPAFEVSGNALAGMASPAATQQIITWATEAPADGARNFQAWLVQMHETGALANLSASQDMAFKSPEIAAVYTTATSTADPGAILPTTSQENPPPPPPDHIKQPLLQEKSAL